jgi:hypothetical protein
MKKVLQKLIKFNLRPARGMSNTNIQISATLLRKYGGMIVVL